jgi:hypothetical protein
MTEEWRQVVGWPAYEVSDLGRVRSLPRIACDGRRWKGKVLRATTNNGKAHPTVALSNGKVKYFYVHHLVLAAFVGPCPEGSEACHNDGVKDNNRRGNLRWGSRSSNAIDTLRHGQRDTLSEYAVRAIRKLLSEKIGYTKIAIAVGATKKQVADIAQRKTWRHVP